VLEEFNKIAKSFNPPHRLLKWEDVVEYAFLSEFNLLCNSRDDIRFKQWSTPSAHALIDQYFKILRAPKEIQRLNIKIKCVMAYMRDEPKYLQSMELALRPSNPSLTHQMKLYRKERGQFNHGHVKQFAKLALHPDFSGSLAPGDAINKPAVSIPMDDPPGFSAAVAEIAQADDSESESEDDDLIHLTYKVLGITMDEA
jgi:hypothetical protein